MNVNSCAESDALLIVGGSYETAASGRSYPDKTFARRPPSPFDDPRSREVRTRRMSPPRFSRDGEPPMKRSRGGPPMSRGGSSMSRGPRRRGSFASRGRPSRRY